MPIGRRRSPAPTRQGIVPRVSQRAPDRRTARARRQSQTRYTSSTSKKGESRTVADASVTPAGSTSSSEDGGAARAIGAPDRSRGCDGCRTRDSLRGDMACDGQYRRRGRCAAGAAMRRAVRAMLNNGRARLGRRVALAAHGAGSGKAALGADLYPRWRRARRERVGEGRCKRIQQDRDDRNPDPNSPTPVVRHIFQLTGEAASGRARGISSSEQVPRVAGVRAGSRLTASWRRASSHRARSSQAP